MMRDRDYHKKQYVKHNSEYHWRLYQTFRNKVNIDIWKSKSRYYCQKIGQCNKNDPKNIRKPIKFENTKTVEYLEGCGLDKIPAKIFALLPI